MNKQAHVMGSPYADEAIGPAMGSTLAPLPFAAAVVLLYACGVAGQWLTAPIPLARFGLWSFLLMQAVLTAAWHLVHARRLRDAARSTAIAAGVALIHVLAIVLLLQIGAFYMETVPAGGWTPQSWLLLRELLGFTRGAGDPLTILGLIACAALLLAPLFSLWTALQPRSSR